MGETVAIKYLRLRAQGMGCREAAREAGYATRAPSRVAAQAALIPQLKREPKLCATYDAQLNDLNTRIKALRKERDRVADLMELCIILDP
jgi:hypothetical protein